MNSTTLEYAIESLIESAKKARDAARDENPERGRLLSIAITNLETAKLFAAEADKKLS